MPLNWLNPRLHRTRAGGPLPGQPARTPPRKHPSVVRAEQAVEAATNWIELYKQYEVAKRALGGTRGVDALVGKTERDRFTRTANHHRHAQGGPYRLPDNAMTLEEADAFVLGLTRTAFSPNFSPPT
jgi:hypothetical protein